MKLLRFQDMPPLLESDHVYRYSRMNAVLAFGIIALGAALMVITNRPPVVGPFFGSFMILIMLMLSRFALGRFGPHSWLVRTSIDGLYLNFRSYLAKNYPEDQPTVVFIAFNEIANAQIVKEHTRLPQVGGTSSQEIRHTYLDLHLTSDASELAELKEAIQREIDQRAPLVKTLIVKSRTSYDHHPVRCTDDGLRIEWGVVPSVHQFEEMLGTRVRFEPLRKVLRDLRKLHKEDKEKQESELIELVESGQKVSAVRLAMKLYKFDLTQAKDFVDGLRGSKEPTEGQLLRADEPTRWTQLHRMDADRLPPA